MLLNDLSMKKLLDLHNQLANSPLGLKSFATKAKLVNRIAQLATEQNLSIDNLMQTKSSIEPKKAIQLQEELPETQNRSTLTSKQRGKGIGMLAKQLLLDEQVYSYKVIVEIINEQILEANTTVNAIRWYTCKLRKAGVKIPNRR